MTDGVIFSVGWTLDDVDWSRFEPAQVDPAPVSYTHLTLPTICSV